MPCWNNNNNDNHNDNDNNNRKSGQNSLIVHHLFLNLGGGGDGVRLLNFCLDPIDINSVFVLLGVNFLAISQRFIFDKSRFKET